MRYVGQDLFYDRIALGIACLCAAPVVFGVAIVLVVFPPLLPVLFAGLVYAALCLHRPLIGFFLAMVFQVFDQLLILVPYSRSGDASFINSLTVPKLMFGTLVVMLIPRVLFTRDEEPLRGLRSQALFIQLASLFVLTSLPGVVYSGINGAVILSLSRLVNCVALSLAVLALIQSFRSLCGVFATLVPAFVITGMMGTYEVVTQTYILDLLDRPIPEDFEMSALAGQFRVLGPSGDAVYYAVSLLFAITAVLVVIQMSRRKLLLVACLACLGLFTVSMLSTASRGGILGCAALGIVFFGLAKIRHKWMLVGATAAFCVVSLLIYTLTISQLPLARFLGRGGADEGTNNRLGFWTQCIHMVEDSPVLGVGLGQFSQLQINHYFDSRTPQRKYLPHNVYLQIPAESGPLALLIYLGLLAACALPLLGAVVQTRDVQKRNVGAAVLGGVVGLATFASNTNLRDNELVWLMFALSVVAARVCRDTGADTISSPVPAFSSRPIATLS